MAFCYVVTSVHYFIVSISFSSTPVGRRYQQLMTQVEQQQEELYRLEAGKDVMCYNYLFTMGDTLLCHWKCRYIHHSSTCNIKESNFETECFLVQSLLATLSDLDLNTPPPKNCFVTCLISFSSWWLQIESWGNKQTSIGTKSKGILL